MDTNQLKNPDEARAHVDNLQNQIDQLKGQTQTAPSTEKPGLFSKIKTLMGEKDQVMSKIKELEATGKTMEGEVEDLLGKI
jgi:hypothetical protein